MTDKKISELTAATAFASADELVVVDKSDTTDAASGTTKRFTLADVTALVPGEVKRTKGTDLTNGAETLQVGEGGIRVLPDGTLSGATSRAKTLGTTGATDGRILTIALLDDDATETVTIVNGGAGAGTLVTHTAIKAIYEFRFDGTDWVLSGWDVVA